MYKFFCTALGRNRLSDLLTCGVVVTALYAHTSSFAQSLHAQSLFTQSVVNGPSERSTLTYHSNSTEVRLVFFATDERHHSITDVQQDDFAIVDDDMVIRHFRSFTPAPPFRLDVVVLIDTSESVLPHLEQELTNVLHALSRWPGRSRDKLSVLSFSGTRVRTICAGNCENELPQKIASLETGGTTPLFDAVSEAARLLVQHREPDVWPVVILFSDGRDTISTASFQEARNKILASEAQIYAIDISNSSPDNGTATLQTLADDSGGRYLRMRTASPNNFSDVMNSIVADLHSARVVTYALPDSDSTFHSVRILPTHNLTWQFHCRRGYYDLAASN